MPAAITAGLIRCCRRTSAQRVTIRKQGPVHVRYSFESATSETSRVCTLVPSVHIGHQAVARTLPADRSSTGAGDPPSLGCCLGGRSGPVGGPASLRRLEVCSLAIF